MLKIEHCNKCNNIGIMPIDKLNNSYGKAGKALPKCDRCDGTGHIIHGLDDYIEMKIVEYNYS